MLKSTSTDCPVLWETVLSRPTTPFNRAYPWTSRKPNCRIHRIYLHLLRTGVKQVCRASGRNRLGNRESNDHLRFIALRAAPGHLAQRRNPTIHGRFHIFWWRKHVLRRLLLLLAFPFFSLLPSFQLRLRGGYPGLRRVRPLIFRSALFFEESIDSFRLQNVFKQGGKKWKKRSLTDLLIF